MKKLNLISTIASVFFLTVIPGTVFSAEMDHSAHGKDSHHSEKAGKMIRHSEVEGYKMMYHLIDMTEHVKHMPEMKDTYHLMVYITAPHGHAVTDAKVGYLITGPDTSEQKVMTMAMGGGFGADIKFKEKGSYEITTKALADGKKLVDRFTYNVE